MQPMNALAEHWLRRIVAGAVAGRGSAR